MGNCHRLFILCQNIGRSNIRKSGKMAFLLAAVCWSTLSFGSPAAPPSHLPRRSLSSRPLLSPMSLCTFVQSIFPSKRKKKRTGNMYTVEFSPFAARQRDKKMFNSQVMARSFIILPPPFSFPLSPCCWKKNFVDTFFCGWPTRIVYYSSLLKCERERERGGGGRNESKNKIRTNCVGGIIYIYVRRRKGSGTPPNFQLNKRVGSSKRLLQSSPHLSWKNKFCFLVYTRQGVPFLLEHTHTHTPFVRGVVCLSGFRSLFICYFFTLSMAGVVVVVVIKSIRELYSSSSLFTGMGTFLEFAQLCCVPQEREKKSGASLPPGERQRKVNAVCNGNTRARNFGTITPRRCRNPSLSLFSFLSSLRD